MEAHNVRRDINREECKSVRIDEELPDAPDEFSEGEEPAIKLDTLNSHILNAQSGYDRMITAENEMNKKDQSNSKQSLSKVGELA